MTARSAPQRGGRGHYRPRPTVAAVPLTLAGLYAVHMPAGAMTHIFYCEPDTGRCSCGAAGSCPHLAIARAYMARAARTMPLREEAA